MRSLGAPEELAVGPEAMDYKTGLDNWLKVNPLVTFSSCLLLLSFGASPPLACLVPGETREDSLWERAQSQQLRNDRTPEQGDLQGGPSPLQRVPSGLPNWNFSSNCPSTRLAITAHAFVARRCVIHRPWKVNASIIGISVYDAGAAFWGQVASSRGASLRAAALSDRGQNYEKQKQRRSRNQAIELGAAGVSECFI
jgi:hypothetical protein